MKRGVTLIELLLAVALGAVVLGGAVTLLASVTRASQTGDLAGALQDASVAMATIERDALRALAAPDGRPAVRLTASEMRLALGGFAPDGRITASLVTYRAEPHAPAGVRLKRTDDKGAAWLPGVFDTHRFEVLGGSGGPYLRVTLTASTNPDPSAARGEPAVLSSLIRLCGSELAGSRFHSLSFLEGVAP